MMMKMIIVNQSVGGSRMTKRDPPSRSRTVHIEKTVIGIDMMLAAIMVRPICDETVIVIVTTTDIVILAAIVSAYLAIDLVRRAEISLTISEIEIGNVMGDQIHTEMSDEITEETHLLSLIDIEMMTEDEIMILDALGVPASRDR
jgi:hypothetical protein